jgi:hypothetical protein
MSICVHQQYKWIEVTNMISNKEAGAMMGLSFTDRPETKVVWNVAKPSPSESLACIIAILSGGQYGIKACDVKDRGEGKIEKAP